MLVAQKSHFSFKYSMNDMTGVGHACVECVSGLTQYFGPSVDVGAAGSTGQLSVGQ